MSQRVNITSPVGRIVMGSLYKPNTTDAENKPLVYKTGPNAGQPRSNYFFAIAIPKGAEQHWAYTPWGQQIWNIGNTAFPNIAQSPAFSWKIEDGDSQIPNKKGKKPCDNEGWRGHWILKFSGAFQPKVFRQEGGGFVQMVEVDAVKPGYFVEVSFSCEGNGSTSQPGVYLNHGMVCFRAFGQEIVFGPDVASAGFGQSALPAGASMTPPPSAAPMPAGGPAMPTAPGVPGVPGMPPAVPQAPAMMPPAMPAAPGVPGMPAAPAPLAPVGSVPTPAAPAPTAPVPVMPNQQFLQVPPGVPQAPGVPAAPVAPAAPAVPAAPVRQMTPAAQGVPYEAYIAQGWNDALLIQNGLMLA